MKDILYFNKIIPWQSYGNQELYGIPFSMSPESEQTQAKIVKERIIKVIEANGYKYHDMVWTARFVLVRKAQLTVKNT